MIIKERIAILDSSVIQSILKSDKSDDLCDYILNLTLDPSNNSFQESNFLNETDNMFDIACKYVVFSDENLPKCLKYNSTLFHLCAYYGACECFKKLISSSTSIYSLYDIVDDKGKSVSHFAAYSGNIYIFFLLEENGFNLNQKDNKGKTPIYIAVKHDKLSIVKYLFINRNTNKPTTQNNENINNNNDNQNQNHDFLFNDETNNIINDDDETLAKDLLHIAAESNSSMALIKILLTFAKTIKLFDENGVSLFSKVIDRSSIEFLSILLESFDQCIDSTGLFPIHHAAAIANSAEVVKLLLEYGADTECRSSCCSKRNVKQGETPIITACKHGSFEGILALLEFEADYDAVDEDGRTPFYYAAKSGRIDIAEVLLDFGADPEICDSSLMAPVDIAYQKRNTEMMTFFKELGIEPQIEDEFDFHVTKRHKKNEKQTSTNNNNNDLYIYI